MLARIVERITDWASAVGGPGLFVVAALDSSFLSFPQVNDLLIIFLSTRNPLLMPYYASMTTAGSLLGCFALYAVAWRGGEMFLRRRFSTARVERALALYQRHGLLAVVVPALLPPPVPFKIFVLSAGVFRLPLRRFLVTIGVARSIRYGFWGFMGAAYGDRGLELLRRFDRWFLDRAEWFLAAAVIALVALLIWALRRRWTATGAGEAR